MTPIQRTVLEFIKAFTAQKGYAPTYREIATHIASTVSVAHYVVHKLIESRHLRRSRHNKHRNLVVVEPSHELAFSACALLVAAYNRGQARGGSIDWQDLSDAHERATAALVARGPNQ